MRLRLILAFTLIVLVSVVTMVLIARQGTANEVRAFMMKGGMTDLTTLVDELEAYYKDNGSWVGVENLLQRGRGPGGMGSGGPFGGMGAAMMNQHLLLADGEGQVVYDSAGEQVGMQLNSTLLEQSTPLKQDRETIGYLVAEGGLFSPGSERLLLERLSRAAVIAGLIAGSLSLLLALLLANRLLLPVRELTGASQQLAQGDLSQRVRIHGNDEIASLGRTFNQMADSLQKAESSRKAMTADIAHELRNPLAIQRAHLEALADGIYPLERENLRPILEQNVLLGRLVDDLRTLALADAGQLSLELVPINPARLIQEVVERFRPQAEAHQINLKTELAALPVAHLDPGRMEQLLINLLSNALRFTPDQGQITVGARPETVGGKAEQIIVTIKDTGPGIPPDSLPHIFERFYRADRSRSREEGGSGLGLAIARQIAQAHGGSLTAANHARGGAIFTLTLPINRGT